MPVLKKTKKAKRPESPPPPHEEPPDDRIAEIRQTVPERLHDCFDKNLGKGIVNAMCGILLPLLRTFITALFDNKSIDDEFNRFGELGPFLAYCDTFDEVTAPVGLFKNSKISACAKEIAAKINVDDIACSERPPAGRSSDLFVRLRTILLALEQERTARNFIVDLLCLAPEVWSEQLIGRFAAFVDGETMDVEAAVAPPPPPPPPPRQSTHFTPGKRAVRTGTFSHDLPFGLCIAVDAQAVRIVYKNDKKAPSITMLKTRGFEGLSTLRDALVLEDSRVFIAVLVSNNLFELFAVLLTLATVSSYRVDWNEQVPVDDSDDLGYFTSVVANIFGVHQDTIHQIFARIQEISADLLRFSPLTRPDFFFTRVDKNTVTVSLGAMTMFLALQITSTIVPDTCGTTQPSKRLYPCIALILCPLDPRTILKVDNIDRKKTNPLFGRDASFISMFDMTMAAFALSPEFPAPLFHYLRQSLTPSCHYLAVPSKVDANLLAQLNDNLLEHDPLLWISGFALYLSVLVQQRFFRCTPHPVVCDTFAAIRASAELTNLFNGTSELVQQLTRTNNAASCHLTHILQLSSPQLSIDDSKANVEMFVASIAPFVSDNGELNPMKFENGVAPPARKRKRPAAEPAPFDDADASDAGTERTHATRRTAATAVSRPAKRARTAAAAAAAPAAPAPAVDPNQLRMMMMEMMQEMMRQQQQ